MRTLHVVTPTGVDDPLQPSGGNVYDRRVMDELEADGWNVVQHIAPGAWPMPDAQALSSLDTLLGQIRSEESVLIDGLVGSAAGDVLEMAASRLRLILLVHMPLGLSSSDVRDRERQAVASASCVIATSAWTQQQLIDTYALTADRVRVAPPGADSAAPAFGSRSGGRLLCVGAVTPVKGHDQLLHALAELRDLRWRCTCVGSLDRDAAFSGAVTRRAAAALPGRVDFTGALAGDALGSLFAGADLLVVPSRAETYGMVISEALARAIPVVANDVGGVSEALGETSTGRPGLLVSPVDFLSLADAVRRWLVDEPLRKQLRLSARERRGSLPTWKRTRDVIAQTVAGTVVA